MWEILVNKNDTRQFNSDLEYKYINDNLVNNKIKLFIPNYPVCNFIKLSLSINESDSKNKSVKILCKFNNGLMDNNFKYVNGLIDNVNELINGVLVKIDNNKECICNIINLKEEQLYGFGGYLYLMFTENFDRVSNLTYTIQFNENVYDYYGERRDSGALPSKNIKKRLRSGQLITGLANGKYQVNIANKEFTIKIDETNQHIVRDFVF